ncbi:ABC transporter substrate-binding protein [Marinobacter sp. 2_MG-2023]|uniref:substrate-binding periplasmic protein n=1 Tax=Marinobacter sp. 2_MG-2023 TaxID=3062679 RepID=UPI0026E1C363|nr:transporter substrate-binding domain-containing protein [Marinobacter sp. 2_MG-2023]MDO6443321.1 transporter substrate-binding domain-containing protein [Marinobacter sp. 2_MG-2023]
MRILVAILFAAMALSANAQQGTETVRALTVTVGADHAPPYRIIEGAQPSGLYVEIFREITNRLGWETHYREAPFRRVLKMVRRGEVDVMLGALKTSGRDEQMVFVAPAFPPERRLFLHIKDSDRIERYADLYGKTIGVLEGASYFPRFDNDGQLHKEAAPRYENLILMMEKGRVDVVVVPELAGLYTVRELELPVQVSPFFVPGERSWIAVARTSPVAEYSDDIRAALKLIEAEGTYENLVLKYMDQYAL